MNKLPKFFKVSYKNRRPIAEVVFPYRENDENRPVCPLCGKSKDERKEGGMVSFSQPNGNLDFYASSKHEIVVSKRVRESILRNNIIGISFFTLSEDRNITKPLDLFWTSIGGVIRVNPNSLNLHDDDICQLCLITIRNPKIKRFIPMIETWDGSDFFRVKNWYNKHIFCTRRVVELAREERWSNLQFEPMDRPREQIIMPFGIDYLGKEWPPENWYPDGVKPDPRNLE